jgi:RNA polymerase sigma-70 factor (ECF subfamily)
LATIARNRALDEIRRGTMRSLEDHPELLQVPSDDDPLANLEGSEQRRRLYACLELLEPEKKEIVLLVYYHGMTREEISSRFKRPVATVKTWLRRSLAQLKDCLGQ